LRRPMVLLSLIAALAGTPMRLAEAANDIVCSLAELGGGDVVEIPDGGVGDDPEAAIKADVRHIPLTIADADGFWGCLILASPVPPRIHRPRADRPTRPAESLPRRLAMLQCFLC
jgi:hypothetical protein